MRFLFGIVIGAALTLLIATTADAPTNPVLQQLQSVWQQFIHGTGELLFRHSADPIAQAPAGETTTDSTELLSTTQTSAANELSEPSAPAATPVTPATPEPFVMPQYSDELDMLLDAPFPATLDTAEIAAVDENQASEPAIVSETETTDLADVSTASVWIPFHSERSAAGFANRLSQHFAYPFAVQRQGPGAYQVVFSYEDPDERETMLLEIAELTGL